MPDRSEAFWVSYRREKREVFYLKHLFIYLFIDFPSVLGSVTLLCVPFMEYFWFQLSSMQLSLALYLIYLPYMAECDSA